MHRKELCFPLGMLLFSHNDGRRASFLPAKISSASNPGSQTCLWLFCSRGRNCSSAQLQNFSSPRLWASLTSVPVWAIKIPFNNQHSPVWEAYRIILSKGPRLPWCFLAIFIRARAGTEPRGNAWVSISNTSTWSPRGEWHLQRGCRYQAPPHPSNLL